VPATFRSHSWPLHSRIISPGAGVLALLTSACGRYGPLEPPPDPNAPPKPANPNGLGSIAKPSIPPIKAPNQPFFLDFLLK
jgi:predicted small lipoprotein YifL